MAANKRQNQILEILKQNGSVSVCDLAETLKVSLVTIRKDLSLLEQEKLLYRSHGTAIIIDPYINDRHISEKEKLYRFEKKAIATVGAELISEKDSIIIASGTTVSALATEIAKRSNSLTVVSASVNVTSILSMNKSIEVIQLGGFVRNSSVSVVGEVAEKMLEYFSCSKLFIGVDGIDLEYGLTTTNSMEASLNRSMIKAAQKTIVLCDSSKFGRRGFGRICGLEEVDQIITDDKISAKTLETLQNLGIEVTLVSNL